LSRVGAGLVERGIVARGADETDGRGVQLALSRSGERLCEGLIRAAAERNDAFLGCLSRSERECLEGALQKLGDQARAFIQQEKVLGKRKRKP
jgi:DNA-binding MarR family transcriptional regulator